MKYESVINVLKTYFQCEKSRETSNTLRGMSEEISEERYLKHEEGYRNIKYKERNLVLFHGRIFRKSLEHLKNCIYIYV